MSQIARLLKSAQNFPTFQITRNELHPGTDVENGRRVAEEEQNHGTNGEERCEDGEAHEDGGRLEGEAGDVHEVVQTAATLLAVLLRVVAHGPQTEFAGIRALDVTDPLGRHERDHPDDGVANGEYRPQDTDRLRITHVTCRVDLRRVHILDLRAHFALFTVRLRV